MTNLFFFPVVSQTTLWQQTPASWWWRQESVSRRERAGWTLSRGTSTSLNTSSLRSSGTAPTASSSWFPTQVSLAHTCSFFRTNSDHPLNVSTLQQLMCWLMWPGNWAAFPSTASSAAAPTWTRHASASWWLTNWESTPAASMVGSWESMETPVVRTCGISA